MPLFSRTAPWAPGLLSVDPLGFASRLAFTGRSRGDIVAQMRERFADLTPQRIGQIASQAIRTQGVLATFDRRLNAPFARQDLPRDSSLSNAYRFIANVTYRDPETGARFVRTVVLESNTNLGQRQINQLAQQAGQQVLGGARYGIGAQQFARLAVEDVELVFAARRT